MQHILPYLPLKEEKTFLKLRVLVDFHSSPATRYHFLHTVWRHNIYSALAKVHSDILCVQFVVSLLSMFIQCTSFNLDYVFQPKVGEYVHQNVVIQFW